jgi:hypothetical protein
MEAQCPCVSGEERVPKPDCERCGGSGFCKVSFPDETEVKAFWIGRCPVCGSENGGYVQFEGKNSPLEDEYEKENPPVCFNDACSSDYVQWIKASDVIRAWKAVCVLCSTVHPAFYLQRHGDPLPPGVQERTCPHEACPNSLMVWERAGNL